jgi:hypothetical protein
MALLPLNFLTNYCDYVFEENYQLMPLNELETYVNTNKHLPEVKSAKEFKEEGYSLGKIDDVILRKVEELTLYMIAQQKIIDELVEKVRSLEEIMCCIEYNKYVYLCF